MSNDEQGKGYAKKIIKWLIALLPAGCSTFIIIFLCTMVAAVFVALGILTPSKAIGKYSSISYAYEMCTSIEVEGESQALSLEDYVMGVVSAEADHNQDIEALKAQAIASRTYAISATKYCKEKIKNDSTKQNYTSNIRDDAREATEATAGLVLTYDDKIFASEYDSFFKGGDFSCNQTECSVTYTKEPSGETHLITIPIKWQNQFYGGHGRGMSQVMSYHLANSGYNYEQILKYFYSDGVEIQKLAPTAQGIIGGNYKPFRIRTEAPNSNDIYFNSPYVSNSNRGQCVWYVKGRAIEIISEAVTDSDLKEQAINALKNTGGNGRDWWNNASLEIFGSSSNYKEPRVGSIIVWRYTQQRIDEMGWDYGHVAIIESIDSDGKVTVTDGWAQKIGNEWSCPNSWACVRFQHRVHNSLEEFYNYVTSSNGRIFEGYVYLLG